MEYERLELFQPHYGTVNIYRIGDTLVDTGHPCPESRKSVREALDGPLAGIDRVVLTHPHIDHVGGCLTIDDLSALPVTVFEGTDEILRSFESYLRDAREEMATFGSGLTDGEPQVDDRYFPVDIEYATDDVEVEQVASAGDTVSVGPYDCEVIHTPGHSQQHMSLYHESSGVMLSGDIVSTNGHFMYGPLHWDIGAYKTGLKRIRECEPELLLPGHGDPMDDPAERVEDALEKAERAEQAVLSVVREQGPIPAHDLAVEALEATETTVQFLTNVASAYAIHLAEAGEIEVERRPYVVARPR
ncbi:MBL fold metallo-hydrolase [Halovenus sp. WSH3]|uniref:MBL fold metallo-hydrolase n=1 Tax=Halovenus carboxidivorans TaxID=2692199 RepID=A0A6B0TIA8_9EURY|nr:MBL fold metallo-hydrolase [Halovenus carboxidivorans]MXR52939.1 MBL fold metallo-hydrolase [Halovenus carboxidivorans]